MTNIIEQIIEIDNVAQKKLEEVNEIAELYRLEVEQTTAADKKQIDDETAQKIQLLTENAEKLLAEQKAAIREQNKLDMARLEKLYDEKHENLEKDILKNIIG